MIGFWINKERCYIRLERHPAARLYPWWNFSSASPKGTFGIWWRRIELQCFGCELSVFWFARNPKSVEYVRRDIEAFKTMNIHEYRKWKYGYEN